MTDTSDPELQEWRDIWRASADAPAGAAATIYRHVRRRSRLLWLWLAGEVAVTAVVTPSLVWLAIRSEGVEQLALLLLIVLVIGMLGFSFWNWRGTVRQSGRTTSAFLQLSTRRVQKLRRAIGAGWLLLVAEVGILSVWVGNRLYARATPPSTWSEVFSWGLLGTMTLLAALCLIALQRWADDERTQLDLFRKALDE